MVERPDKPDFERVLTALKRQEPDRVPIVETQISEIVQSAFMGREIKDIKSEIEFRAAAGMDFNCITRGLLFNWTYDPALDSIAKTTTGVYNPYGVDTENKWAEEGKGVIFDMESFEKFPWPTPDDVDYESMVELAKLLPPGMKFIVSTGKVFSSATLLMGLEHFSYCLADDIGLVEAVFEWFGKNALAVMERLVEYKGKGAIGAFELPDDLAYAEGLLVSPKFLRKYVFPWHKKMCEVANQADIPVILHSDGDVTRVLDDILDAGFTALHPIEPKAMDIVEVKAKIGHKMSVIGNIDLAYTLTRGTPDDVRAEVRERIRTVGPGGGYCMAASNSVPEFVPIENYEALLQATYDFGKYPINL